MTLERNEVGFLVSLLEFIRDMEVIFENHTDYDLDFIKKEAFTRIMRDLADTYGYSFSTIFYQFIPENEMIKHNKNIHQHDYLTDVITLEYDHSSYKSMEVFMSPKQIQINAKNYAQTFENEFNRVVFHAFLHCIGYDDQSSNSQQKMREMEETCLSRLI